jgi:uncharacterized membrane-anchored protein
MSKRQLLYKLTMAANNPLAKIRLRCTPVDPDGELLGSDLHVDFEITDKTAQIFARAGVPLKIWSMEKE